MTENANVDDDVIDKASIIENKEKTKVYWETMMMAAANEKTPGKSKSWTTTETKKTNGLNTRNSKNERLREFTLDSLEKQNSINSDVEWDSEPEWLSRKNDLNEELMSREGSPLSMEGKIALELQEMKEREEELREWRNKVAVVNCKGIPVPKVTSITNGNEELSSLHTTDGSNYSEYGSEEKEHSLDENSRVNTPYSEDFIHIRTQSLDSVSSGHSSGSGSALNERDRDSPRRRIMVRPYEDPEEEDHFPSYAWDGKETPIEKEIRLAREREEELRREKGSTAIMSNCKELNQKAKSKTQPRREALDNDPRGIQHRLATSRIQQEIEEATERERELRTEGKIILTSEETLDSKVTRLSQLVENSIMENKFREQKIKKPTIYQLPLSIKIDETAREVEKAASISVNRRYIVNPKKKGVMQQFFSAKGRPFITKVDATNELSPVQPCEGRSFAFRKDGTMHTRKGYVPVAEKIQEELKDNQKREEELRLQRARISNLARSQPNLLDISDCEDEPQSSWCSGGYNFSTSSRLIHSLSNPNLLDETFENVHKRPSSKKFSLLEEWEKRIKESEQKE